MVAMSAVITDGMKDVKTVVLLESEMAEWKAVLRVVGKVDC